MRVLLFGGSGMVGQGILRECLLDPAVTEILSVSRKPLPSDGVHAALPQKLKLREIVRPDLFEQQDFTDLAEAFTGMDACFFPLGVSAFRMPEPRYRHVTFDLTLSIARLLARSSPGLVFVYVSGAGTNAASKTMWARVKGETENALRALPLRAVYLFRPGLIIAKDGIRSRTRLYDLLYRLLAPLLRLLERSPRLASTTRTVGRAMLNVTRDLPEQPILDNAAIHRAAHAGPSGTASAVR